LVPQPIEEATIGFALITEDVNALSMNLEIFCSRTETLFAKWKLKTYDRIVTAWRDQQNAYEGKMASLRFRKASVGPLGDSNPDINRQTERTELKRSCIAIIDNDNGTVRGTGPTSGAAMYDFDAVAPQLPEPHLSTAQDVGARVRWFEQAFEWENMAYVCYPYYWARRQQWISKLNLNNTDPMFQSFLRAGYARVVVPVRLGFEWAVHFYLHTGLPWMGGGLPPIGDRTQNPLYLDIAEELKALTGAPKETEEPIGAPWDIIVPTSLVKLRPDDVVPSWSRLGLDLKPDPKAHPSDPPPTEWTWSEDKVPASVPYSTS